tara:strand:- start:346 stop:651 length:306 start_codon:yes stop_codon:yes gene_type:complete
MTKARITLESVETLTGGVDVALIDLTLHRQDLGKNFRFKLRSTAHVVRLMSDHRICDLELLIDWLKESSNNKTLRTNETEILIFARDMFKANKILKESKTF